MNEQLEPLITLQKLDLDIDHLEEKRFNLLREIESLGEPLKDSRREIEEIKARLIESTRERKRKELEVESTKEALQKVQIKLHAVKTNKEYTALLKETENDKVKISNLEDAILNLMELLEEENARLEKKQRLLARAEEDFRREKEKKEVESVRLDELLEEKRKAREEVVAPLEDRQYRSYIRLRKARKGLAIVAVSNGACQGCHISIPPQTVNEIRKNEQIITCYQCNRILYWAS